MRLTLVVLNGEITFYSKSQFNENVDENLIYL